MMGSSLHEITIKKNTYPLNVLAEHVHQKTENNAIFSLKKVARNLTWLSLGFFQPIFAFLL